MAESIIDPLGYQIEFDNNIAVNTTLFEHQKSLPLEGKPLRKTNFFVPYLTKSMNSEK